MLTATKDRILPTTVTGSWPRPAWYTGNLHERPYSTALGDRIRVLEVPGGHYVIWDAYDQTAAALLDFLR